MAKFVNILTWVLFGVALLATLWWFVLSPIIGYIGSDYSVESEIRLYLRLLLLIFVVMTFGILRLFNSIVNNTRFSIKLREALIKFTNTVPGLERAMKNLNSSLGNVKSSTDILKKSTDLNSEKLDKFNDKLNRLKS